MKYLSLILLFALIGCTANPSSKSGSSSATGTKHGENVSTAETTELREITSPYPVTGFRYIEQIKSTSANSGQINTTVAQSEISSKERRPLLYAAMACIGLAGFFVWRAYPTGAFLSGVAAVVFFTLWKLDELPAWLWAVGVALIGIGVGIYLGYERKEKETKS